MVCQSVKIKITYVLTYVKENITIKYIRYVQLKRENSSIKISIHVSFHLIIYKASHTLFHINLDFRHFYRIV